MGPYTSDLLQILRGVESVASVAERHDKSVRAVEAARADLVDALGAALTSPRQPRRHTAALAGGLIVMLCAGGAWAQLVTFAPDAPALASEVNGNFQQLRTWLEQKVGTVGSAAITTSGAVNASSATLSGAVNANSAAVSGAVTAGSLTTGGALNVGTAAVSGNATIAGALTVTGPITGPITGTGSLNGVTIRVKNGNNGTVSCDTYCLNGSFGTFTGSCLGSKLLSGQFTSDCNYVPGAGQTLTCLCATY